jgi:hypothetical protein
MMRQAPPGVAVLAARYSGARDESLHSLAKSLSQSSITTVGIWVEVEDRSAVVYDVEFLRAHVSGRSAAMAHRVAVAQVALEYPAMAGAAFLLPGLANGYGKIETRLRWGVRGQVDDNRTGVGDETKLIWIGDKVSASKLRYANATITLRALPTEF